MNILDLIKKATEAGLSQGDCLEVHVGPQGELGVERKRRAYQFWNDWFYATDDLDSSVCPSVSDRWLGVVHADGAFVVRLP